MAQLNWTYVADSGQQYRVVLYHGGRSGHVLVTVNQKVSIVDFYVRDSKSYQILLEDELFLLELEKGPTGFGYAFAIDTVADTDRNRTRRIQKKRQAVWIVMGALVFFGIAGSLATLLMNWQENRTLKKNLPLLDEIGEVAYGRVAQQKDGSWTLFFTEGPMIYKMELDASAVKIAGLKQGDDQGVVYLKGNPKVNRVSWAHPGPTRSRRLLESWMSEWNVLDERVKDCLIRALLEKTEWLTQPDAPWIRPGRSWTEWLGDQPVSMRARLETACGPVTEID